MIRLAIGPCLAFSALLAIASCTDLGDPTVVSMRNRTVDLGEVRQAYADLPTPQRPLLGTREARRDFVNQLVERWLLADYGKEVLGPDRTPEFDREIEQHRFDAMNRRLRTLLVGEHSIPEEEIDAAYERMQHLHRVERLYFSSPAEAVAAAERRRVASGSGGLDRLTGELGAWGLEESWIAWSPFPDAEADIVVELEPGDVAGPLPAGLRWQLVRLIERIPNELEPFENVRSHIIRGLRVRAQSTIVAEFETELAEGRDLEFSEEGLALLVRRTREAILSVRVTQHDPGWGLPEFLPEEEVVPVATWNVGHRWTPVEYLRMLKRLIPGQRPKGPLLAAEVRRLCEDSVGRHLFHEEAERRGLGSDWWVRKTVERFRTDRLVQTAIDHLGSRVEVAPAAVDSIARILNESRPGLFRTSETARVVRFDLATEKEALAERERILRAGGALARLRQMLDGAPDSPGTYQILDLTREGSLAPGVAEEIFGSAPGRIVGPFEYVGGWSLMECLSKRQAKFLTPEEIRAQVEAQLRRGESRRVVAEWVQVRRQELAVAVDDDALDALAPGA